MQYNTQQQQHLFEETHQLLLLDKKTLNEQNLQPIVEKLHELIPYHEWRYYILNEPVISDFEYDELFALLKYIEEFFPAFASANSPTQRVSSDLTEDFSTVTHLTPMLSLENSYNSDDLLEFDKRIKKLMVLDENKALAYAIEPKFDGGTIVVRYVNNNLEVAATRGNGAVGEDITNNAKVLKTLPMKANFASLGIHTVELRGEVLLKKSNFQALNKARLANGEPLLANPRNAATGAIRLKSAKEVAQRKLEVFVYQISYAADVAGNPLNLAEIFPTHTACIDMLAQLGFKTPTPEKERKACKSINEVIDFCNFWNENRDKYEYEIDGMVVKLDNLQAQNQLGYTSHHPRWAAAYKFPAKQATTKLENIEFQVGRTGAITPVAKVSTVEVAGVQISSISLHNADLIQQKDIRKGDIVLVERAGDVIPQIVKPMVDLRTGEEEIILFPTHCPACQTLLEKEAKEAAWRCPNNISCPDQQVQKFIHFASKDAMNIDGLGDAQIERFYKLGYLQSLKDLFLLDYNAIAQLDGMGKRSSEKLKANVEKAKANPAARLLFALGIRHIGKTTSRNIVQAIEKLQDLATWTAEDLMRLNDIGPKAAEQIVKAFADNNLLDLLNEFEAMGINTTVLDDEKAKAANPNAPLSGKNLLFTGTLANMKRDEGEEMARQAGAKIVSSVSKNLDYLVAGEAAGSKLEKAQKLNIPVISEAEFLTLIGKGNN